LRAEYHGSGKQALADTLLPYLTDGIEHDSYRAAAEALGMNSGAVRVAVHRLRRRFGQILRRQIADTVSAPDEIDDEIRQMIRALAS
jgi:RNA polymerase sigma-70 factor (ECF subfamily)